MKKFFRPLTALILGTFLFSSLALAFSVNQFQYVSSIGMEDAENNGPVWLPVTQDVRQAASVYDLRIADNEGTEIPYAIFTEVEESLASQISFKEVSSTREAALGENFDATNMLDGDKETYYEADYLTDVDTTYFVLDLGEPQFTNQLAITLQDSSKYLESLKIDLSNDAALWREAVSLTRPQTTIDYPETLAQYIRVTVTYTNSSLMIAELDVIGTTEAKLLFEAVAGVAYNLYYGSVISSETDYDTDHLFTTIDTPAATLGEKTDNPDYNSDLDNGGVVNIQDNCPFIENNDQIDSDNDSLGDVCDNAPEDRNRTQFDYDEDGIGDDADNCPLHENSDQMDKDLDGIGWVCDDEDADYTINSEDNCLDIQNWDQSDVDGDGIGDECDEQDDRFTEKNQWILWVVMGLAAAGLLWLGYRMIQKK